MRPSKRREENERSWDGDGVSPLETSGENLEAWKEGVQFLGCSFFQNPRLRISLKDFCSVRSC